MVAIELTILIVNVEIEVTWSWIAGDLEVGAAVLGMVLVWACSVLGRKAYTRCALASLECDYWGQRHVVATCSKEVYGGLSAESQGRCKRN